MSKGTFFTGQPIFTQMLSFIPRALITTISRELNADHYCKTFKTYDHLVTMLYAIFNQCTSLREVTTGLLAWDQRIHHLGIDSHPRRSTISDANKKRTAEVFEKIYFGLLNRHQSLLPDSRKRSRKNNLYIFDSTSIALFQEILKGSGLSKKDGRRKGGIKVHTLLHAREDLPTMIRYSSGADNDGKYLKEVQLPLGSVIVFDKGYRDYSTYNRFASDGITWITRHRDSSVYKINERKAINESQKKQGVVTDWCIELGHNHSKKAIKVPARMISYKDPVTKKKFQFITNNRLLAPITVANYYKQRWQIETFFKRIKQNYPLQYFLGDNENAIKIQIWCALIADLLLKVIKRGVKSKMAFSNIVGLVRLHLMTYMDLKSFLRAPEKALLKCSC
ncbi:MAG: IS4 family transposase [Agriterribacter sp.]